MNVLLMNRVENRVALDEVGNELRTARSIRGSATTDGNVVG